MKTKRFLSITMMLVATFGALVSFCSCEDDDETKSNGKGLYGWYVDKSVLCTTSDFNEINKAIMSHEVLQDLGWAGGHHYITYADKDLFFYSDGTFNTYDAHFGRLRFSIDSFINVYRLQDDNTMAFYSGALYKENASGAKGKEAFYSVYGGSMLGTLTFYLDTPMYYTYARIENKIIVSNGDIFTITSSGLIKDGASYILSKVTPQN